MKHILFVLAFLFVGITVNAQSRLLINPSNNPAITGVVDTLKNAGTITLQTQVNPSSDATYVGATFNIEVTKVSGTLAGTFKLYGGIKGASGTITWDSLNVYTVTNTAGTQSANIVYTYVDSKSGAQGIPYEYFRLYGSGGTTMALIPKAKVYLWGKKSN